MAHTGACQVVVREGAGVRARRAMPASRGNRGGRPSNLVMAYIVIALYSYGLCSYGRGKRGGRPSNIVMACMVMACGVMARNSPGPYSHGLYSYGLYGYGPYSDGLYSYGYV